MPSEPKGRRPHAGGDEPPSFEEALDQLESLIERIEGGEVGLEQSIAEYERGMTLIRRCREILERAQQRVEELSRDQLPGGGSSKPARDGKPRGKDDSGDEPAPF